MRVAIPMFGEDISPRFCFAREMVVIERQGSDEVSRERVMLGDVSWPGRFSVLTEHRVDVLLCGGFPRDFLPLAAAAGVRVIVGLAGTVEQVAKAFFDGTVEELVVMPCRQRGGDAYRAPAMGGSLEPRNSKMNENYVIAVAVDGDGGLDAVVSEHFGHCAGFVVVEVERGGIKASREVANPFSREHQPGALPKVVQGLGARVLLAGGMGQKAQSMLARSGIEVATGAAGHAREAIEAFLRGELRGFVPCADHGQNGACGGHHHSS
jgi:predicted Fe-Mo cluster-binding NifX family protein